MWAMIEAPYISILPNPIYPMHLERLSPLSLAVLLQIEFQYAAVRLTIGLSYGPSSKDKNIRPDPAFVRW